MSLLDWMILGFRNWQYVNTAVRKLYKIVKEGGFNERHSPMNTDKQRLAELKKGDE